MGTGFQVEALPNGKFNLVVKDDAGGLHRVELDALFQAIPGLTETLPSGVTTLTTGRIKTLVSQSLAVAAFTDNANTTGFIDFTNQLPAASMVLGWKAVTSGAFDGDTTAVMEVGKSGALGDYSALLTKSVFTAPATRICAAPQLTSFVETATTPRVTVTGTADFTSIVSAGHGVMVVTLYYLDLTV